MIKNKQEDCGRSFVMGGCRKSTKYTWQNAVEPVNAGAFNATVLRHVIRLLTKHPML